jgi:hypothetical protein
MSVKSHSAADPKAATAESRDRSVDSTKADLSPVIGVTDVALAKPDDLQPATDVAASGALIEPTIVERIDTAHPAVDDRPRAGQPVASNRIDFNDPAKAGSDAVAEALGYTKAD